VKNKEVTLRFGVPEHVERGFMLLRELNQNLDLSVNLIPTEEVFSEYTNSILPVQIDVADSINRCKIIDPSVQDLYNPVKFKFDVAEDTLYGYLGSDSDVLNNVRYSTRNPTPTIDHPGLPSKEVITPFGKRAPLIGDGLSWESGGEMYFGQILGFGYRALFDGDGLNIDAVDPLYPSIVLRVFEKTPNTSQIEVSYTRKLVKVALCDSMKFVRLMYSEQPFQEAISQGYHAIYVRGVLLEGVVHKLAYTQERQASSADFLLSEALPCHMLNIPIELEGAEACSKVTKYLTAQISVKKKGSRYVTQGFLPFSTREWNIVFTDYVQGKERADIQVCSATGVYISVVVSVPTLTQY